MTGYRDMTFCSFWEQCEDGAECHRAITPEVIEGGTKWWGGPNFPISRFSDEPECFKRVRACHSCLELFDPDESPLEDFCADCVKKEMGDEEG